MQVNAYMEVKDEWISGHIWFISYSVKQVRWLKWLHSDFVYTRYVFVQFLSSECFLIDKVFLIDN